MKLNGTRCISRSAVKASYRINENFQTWKSSSKTQEFLQKIADLVGKLIEELVILDVSEGSTVVTLAIPTTGDSESASIKQKLGSSSPAGFDVLSSSFGIYYDD